MLEILKEIAQECVAEDDDMREWWMGRDRGWCMDLKPQRGQMMLDVVEEELARLKRDVCGSRACNLIARWCERNPTKDE